MEEKNVTSEELTTMIKRVEDGSKSDYIDVYSKLQEKGFKANSMTVK